MFLPDIGSKVYRLEFGDARARCVVSWRSQWCYRLMQIAAYPALSTSPRQTPKPRFLRLDRKSLKP